MLTTIDRSANRNEFNKRNSSPFTSHSLRGEQLIAHYYYYMSNICVIFCPCQCVHAHDLGDSLDGAPMKNLCILLQSNECTQKSVHEQHTQNHLKFLSKHTTLSSIALLFMAPFEGTEYSCRRYKKTNANETVYHSTSSAILYFYMFR